MFLKRTTLAVAALLASSAALAQVGVTADIGSTGVGAHLVAPLTGTLNTRLGFNAFKHDFTQSSSGVDYQVKGKLQTVDMLLDWYLIPASSFRLTAGLVYNGNHFDALATPNSMGTLTLNGHAYSSSNVGIVTGHVDYRKAAPYLGIGWGNTLGTDGRLSFNADLGAFYQGKAKVQLDSSGCTAPQPVCQAIATDAAAVRTRFGDDIDQLKVYPVLRLSLGYRF